MRGKGKGQGNFHIQIRSETAKYRISLRSLRNTAVEILKTLGWKDGGAHGRPPAGEAGVPLLSILLTSDRKIRSLNRRWLGHDRATDVIAFGQKKSKGVRPLLGKRGQTPFLGDIVISLETARRQARPYGNSLEYELVFYLCHGILHLMGYRDKTKKGAEKMERMQKRILEKMGVKNQIGPGPFLEPDPKKGPGPI